MNLCVCLYPFPKNLPMKRVLVVDNYDSFVYNLVQILREEPTCSFEVVTNDHIPFDRLNEFDRLLLSPGPGVPEEAGDLLPLIDRCYQSHARRMPGTSSDWPTFWSKADADARPQTWASNLIKDPESSRYLI